MAEPAFQDEIHGVVKDENGRSYFLFTRISAGAGPYKWLHVLAQATSGEVFIVQQAKRRGVLMPRLEMTIQDADGGIRCVAIVDSHERKEGQVGTLLAVATQRTKALGTDHLPEDWWQSLSSQQIAQFAQFALPSKS